MSDCCSPSTDSNACSSKDSAKRRHTCPLNNQEYQQVSFNTVIQHVKKPWASELKQQQYYFCTDPDCEVIYFGEDNRTIKQTEIRTHIGIKAPEDTKALICYCFDISYTEAIKDEKLKQFVIEQTKNKYCSCESRNPSGRCCLKDFKLLSSD